MVDVRDGLPSAADRQRRRRANASRASGFRSKLTCIGLPHTFLDVFALPDVQVEVSVHGLLDDDAHVAIGLSGDRIERRVFLARERTLIVSPDIALPCRPVT